MLVLGGLGLLAFVGGSILSSIQRNETERKTVLEVKAKLEKQFLEFKVKAETGDAEAQTKLGECYYQGEGVAKDCVKAVKWYRKAAEQNNAEAQARLGECYYIGVGVEKNTAEAVKWYRKAAY